MPMYDLRCDACERIEKDVLEPLTAPRRRCGDKTLLAGITMECIGKMQRVWLTGKSHHIVGDEIDVWVKNGLCWDDGSPRHFRSQKELDTVARKKGMENHVVHQGSKESDKSEHTVRWDTMSPVKEEDRLRRWHEHEAELLGK